MVTNLRLARPEDAPACAAIVAAAPEHFDADVADEMREAVAAGETAWVAVDGGRPVGVVLVPRPFAQTAELRYLAVRTEHRSCGIGGALVERAAASLLADGVRLVVVYTLDESIEYAPYERTRAFWRQHGFIRVAVFDPFPGWRPGNAGALLVRALSAVEPGT